MSQLNKEVLINLENTAQYQPRSNLNVSFSTADRDSAVFTFNVNKDSEPYLLGPENVKGHIALKHSDKSFIKDTLTFKDPLLNTKGQFEYQMPNELLKRQGSVTMQVLIAEKGLSNVIVAERIVSFNIEQSLVSEISAETKLQYIVELDELYDRIEDRMTLFEQQMASGEDIITRINEAKEKGLSDIEIAKSLSIQEINNLADTKLQQIRTKCDKYSTKFDSDKVYMDEKSKAFKDVVNDSGVVTTGQSKDWQKYKLTNDDGNYPYIDLQNNIDSYHNLETGIYYTVKTPHEINGVATSGFSEMISRTFASATVKKLIFRPYNSNRIFGKWFYKEWSDWEELLTVKDGTEIETAYGSQNKATIAETNAKKYTDEKLKSQMEIIFESRVKGVGSTITLSESLDDFILLYIFIDFPGGEVPCIANPLGSKSIVLNNTNVVDNSDGGGNYEIIIQKLSRTQLKIINDVFWDFGNHRGSGKNANQHTITKIVGVRNYANIS
ncbi:BppU family phage baseplate upper protein [Staphylococcus xylosus]|uniref:BppU family phage baseplate upper protein n=1 Tax=Staphylococcus xylosus TaxID=1288 RepID=UPI000D1D3114|nr:BppU family phage baseplate upper protein [Staphylococcus xylosus]PTI64215.1 hypothetical protein BU095_06365 [Staphylococcus xylosus]